MKTMMSRKISVVASSLMLLSVLAGCSSAPVPAPSASESVSSSASAEASPSASASPTSYRRDTSNPNDTTSEGEPVLEAEKRFVAYATGTVKTKKSNDEILETGYKMCHFFKEEGTTSGVIQRISKDAKNVEEESENLQLSGAAVKTICPEYKDVS